MKESVEKRRSYDLINENQSPGLCMVHTLWVTINNDVQSIIQLVTVAISFFGSLIRGIIFPWVDKEYICPSVSGNDIDMTQNVRTNVVGCLSKNMVGVDMYDCGFL